MIDYANPLTFVPLVLMTLALAFVAYSKKAKKNKAWIAITFVVWLITFITTIWGNKFLT